MNIELKTLFATGFMLYVNCIVCIEADRVEVRGCLVALVPSTGQNVVQFLRTTIGVQATDILCCIISE
jgi:hypothetical protein